MSFIAFLFIFLPNSFAMDLGVNVHLPVSTQNEASAQLDSAVKMKLSWGRMDLIWALVEPNPVNDIATQGNWQIIDASIYQMRTRGIKVLAILTGIPTWATVDGTEQGTMNATGLEHYKRFVTAVASRYKKQVQHFEIYNEPNLQGFYKGTVDTYVDQMLIPAREAIKAANPGAFVTGPALANLMKADIKVQDFLTRLGERQKIYVASTGQKFFDIITHHTYNSTAQAVAEEFTKGRRYCLWFICIKTRDAILNLFDQNGFSTEPLWLTEFGWEAGHDEASQNLQAQKIMESLERLEQIPRMQNVFIYQLRDDPRFTLDYGLLFADDTPKKIYDFLKNR